VDRREVWGTGALAAYLSDAEKKYTAESKVADVITLQQFLRDRIAVETALVATYGCEEAPAVCLDDASPSSDARHVARSALLQSIIERETVVKKIKAAFNEENMKLPPPDRFSPLRGSEIRQKLRERSGAPAAMAAGVAAPNPETWHARKGALQALIEKRQGLLVRLKAAEANLLQARALQPQQAALADDSTLSLLSPDVCASTDVGPDNFDEYHSPTPLNVLQQLQRARSAVVAAAAPQHLPHIHQAATTCASHAAAATAPT
jgi:hypothetical protein